MIFKCYSSEEVITLNILHEVVPTWYSFHSWVDWSNADKLSCSRKQHTAAGVQTVYLCIQNRHSCHPTNMLLPFHMMSGVPHHCHHLSLVWRHSCLVQLTKTELYPWSLFIFAWFGLVIALLMDFLKNALMCIYKKSN